MPSTDVLHFSDKTVNNYRLATDTATIDEKYNDTPALNASRHWAAPLEVEREESCGGCKPAARSSYCHCVGELCRIGAFCVEKDGGKFLISDHSSVERVAAIIL